jgi:uncharacterized protein (DUF2062 family)
MARKFFRRFLPNRERVSKDKWLTRIFGRLLENPHYLHLNRRSAASGIANGVFWAFVPGPIQTIGAIATAMKTKGNILLAAAFTWISNPFTYIPLGYLAYTVGRIVMGREPVRDVSELLSHLLSLHLREAFSYIWQRSDVMVPFLLGCFICAVLSSAISYVATSWTWKAAVMVRYRRKIRRNGNGALKTADRTPPAADREHRAA